MRFFHGEKQSGPYFEGWYFKHQNKHGQALAVIPAFHADRMGRRSASMQIITNSKSWWLEYPSSQFYAARDRFQIQIGPSSFDRRGIRMNVSAPELSLSGALRYGPFAAVRSDIMGPFRIFAGMQCSHGVASMRHFLEGSLCLNGEIIDFSDGVGYIETDRGRSFPDVYLWTQCVWGGPEDGSVMLAAASVPLPVGSFTGCICAIFHRGREYRLATYLGARLEKWSSSEAVVRQGKYRFSAALLDGQSQPLLAPAEGGMGRTVRESLCAAVRYCFWSGKELLFQHTDQCASFDNSDQRRA